MAKPPLQFGELGKTGLPVYGGRVSDDPNPKITQESWRKAVRDMTANDASIRSLLFLIEMIARHVEWKIVPWDSKSGDDELAQFVRECLFEDMQQTWQDTLAEILSFLPWGWSWFEIVYKRRGGASADKTKNSRYTDGRVGWRKWAIRSQESLLEWKFDEWDEIEALIQQPAPLFDVRVIPFEKSLHFRTTSHKQNPEGLSMLRGAYRSWYFKANIENIEGIGIERDLAGLPVIYAPPSLFKSDRTPAETQLFNYLQSLATQIRRDEQEGVVFPLEYNDKGKEQYKIELLSTGGQRQFDTSAIIDRYDQRMLMSAMGDFLLLGSKTTGSYALGETKWKAFLKAMKTWLDSICDTVNRYAIPRLIELNGKPSDRAPYLQASSLEEITLEQLGGFVDVLTKAGITLTPEQQDHLKRKGQLPVQDE